MIENNKSNYLYTTSQPSLLNIMIQRVICLQFIVTAAVAAENVTTKTIGDVMNEVRNAEIPFFVNSPSWLCC